MIVKVKIIDSALALNDVISVQTGIYFMFWEEKKLTKIFNYIVWIPACAGMTVKKDAFTVNKSVWLGIAALQLRSG